MKKHFGLLVAAVLASACMSLPARADTVVASWTLPVQNTDDSPIPATGPGSLVSAKIAWGTCSAPGVFGAEVGSIVRPMPVTSATFNLQPASWCLRVTVTNTYGTESNPSNVVAHVTPPTTPKNPTNFQVTP